MNTVLIQSVIPCDSFGSSLPPSTIFPGGYQVTVLPTPLGQTPLLQLSVICTLIPGPIGSVDFELDLQNLADWALVNVTPGVQYYTLNVTSGIPVILNVQLKNKVPSGTTYSAPLILKAKDSDPAHPNMDTRVVILSES